MLVLKCKMCEGNILPLEGKGIGVCDSCGTQVVLPSLSDERRTDAFNRGNQFRKDCEFDKALEQYSQIVKEDPTDAEAHWCMALCRYGINYQQDYVKDKYIPTCDRLSDTSFLEDPDYQAALRYAKGEAKAIYQREAEHIEKIRQELVRVAAQAEPYDVFICFKDTYDGTNKRTPDSYAAQEIYMFLTEKGYRVFFSRITLKEEHLGQEWEPYIYAALNTARVMLVVGTCKEHFNSPWVKNEWNRFRAIRRKDPTKVLLACYQDMDGRDIPPELQVLETHNIKDSDGGFYSNLNYIVSRECRRQKKPVSAGNVATAENYVTRAYQALEDKDFKKADQLLEQALNMDPENGRAHLGKLLVERKKTKIIDLNQEEKRLSLSGHYQRALKYADAGTQQQLRAIEAQVVQRLDRKKKSQQLVSCRKKMQTAEFSSELEIVVEDLKALGGFLGAAETLEEARKQLKALQEKEAQEEEEERQRVAREEEEERQRKAREAAEKAAAEEKARKEALKAQRRQKRLKRNRALRRLVFLLIILGVAGYFVNKKMVKPARELYEIAENAAAQGDYETAAENYYAVAESPVTKVMMKDAADKGYEALKNWLGWEPVVVTSQDMPWFSVDDDGGLQFDAYAYSEAGAADFVLPTLVDGKLVTGFGNGSFEDLEGLTSISAPANYTWIGHSAFSGCEYLSSLTMENVETIGDYAFSECTSLTNVVLPESTRTLGVSAFEDCSYLNSITLNQGLTSIGENAFYYCSSLSNVTIPGTVEYIGMDAFYGSLLTNLTLESGITSIGESAFQNCDYLTAVTIPGTVTEVGAYAFLGCEALTTVVLESGVSVIGEAAFSGCTQLWNLSLSDTLTSIGNNAFSDDAALGSISLPGTLTSVGEYAFYGCDGITELWVQENSGLTIGAYAFSECQGLTSVNIGAGTLSLEEGAFYDSNLLQWVTLPEGLTTIGPSCFSYTALTEVTLPSTLTTLGAGAFENSKLVGIQIPASVTVIEESTFDGCTALYWVWLPGEVTILRDDAFAYCDSLTQIYYSGSLDSWNAVSKGNNNLDGKQIITDYYG